MVEKNIMKRHERCRGQRPKQLFLCILAVSLASIALGLARFVDHEIFPQWEIVGRSGNTYTVYMSQDGLRDKFFIAQVLMRISEAHAPTKSLEVMLFDNKTATPMSWPATVSAWRHLRARYSRNVKSGKERFVWVKLLDLKSDPPRIKETEESIGPGWVGSRRPN